MLDESKNTPEDELVRELCTHFLDLIKNSSNKTALPDSLMQIPEVAEICEQLGEVRKFSSSLQKGRLDYFSSSRGYLMSILKALQSDLKHITWQMKNVASGGYEEKIYFLGEYSDSFNIMISHLAETMEEIKNLTEKYKELSIRDALTGCHNRNVLDKVGQSTLRRAARNRQSSVLLMLDLDFFKKVNDNYGHPAGDAILCALVRNIYASLRFDDVCCRYGGEEFLIIVPGVSLEAGLSIAERIRQNVEERHITYQENIISVTVSIGVAQLSFEDVFFDTEYSLSTGIKKADENLYVAKRNGRNQVVFK